MIRVKSPQDLGASVLLLAIGVAGVGLSGDLEFGTASNMGPGYFPKILSWCIIVLAAFIGAKALTVDGPGIERMQVRPLGVLVVSSLIFGYAIEQVGLAIASLVAMLVASYARRGANFKESVLLSIGITLFAIIVFAWALGQPLPVWWGN